MFSLKKLVTLVCLLFAMVLLTTHCAPAPTATPAPTAVPTKAAVAPTIAPAAPTAAAPAPTAAAAAPTVAATKAAEPTKAPVAAAPRGAPAANNNLYLNVGKQVPITILINQSPWYPGFEKVVQLYEQQTGNKVNLDATPYAGMLEKARNAVRGKESPYDILNIDTGWIVEFYSADLLTPLKEIDANIKFDPQVSTADDCVYWNTKTQWQDNKGDLIGFVPNANVVMLYYRADLLQQAGLKVPETWDDVTAAADKLSKQGSFYGYVVRGAQGNPIRFDFTSYLLSAGGNFEKDAANGDFTVTVNSPQAKKALDYYLSLAKKYAPPNSGAIDQADQVQLLTTNKALMTPMVTAAWSNMDVPDKSLVVGKVNVAPPPRAPGGVPASVIGNWTMGIPRNVSNERKQAALAFAKWFLTYEAQYRYAEFGAIPVRSDVLESDLASKPEFRWMPAYKQILTFAKRVLGYKEGAQVEAIMGLRLNQALVGELSAAKALNMASDEIYKLFSDNKRKTGQLPKLPE
jgi:multiple sugar transport system substrate-binding protein